MKTKYHTAQGSLQYRAAAADTPSRLTAQRIPSPSRKPLTNPARFVTGRPALVGNRQTLREFRAAEMAAWEAIRPSTKLDGRAPREHQPESLWRLATNTSLKKEAWLILLLAVCAAAAVGLGLCDISRLITGWSRFVEGIHNFLMA